MHVVGGDRAVPDRPGEVVRAGGNAASAAVRDSTMTSDLATASASSWRASPFTPPRWGVRADGRELDAEAVARSLVVVESRTAALAAFPTGSNDLAWAIRDGAVTPDHVHAELGELVSGTRPGRTSADQITLYKSVGVAAQDAAAAAMVLSIAQATGLGTDVPI